MSKKLKKLQEELFNRQRELIGWMARFVPKREKPTYEESVRKISNVSAEIRELENIKHS